METTSDYINRLIKYLDSLPLNHFILITKVATNTERFIELVKFCIQYLKKPYEFSNDYKQIRRIEQ